MKLVSSTGGALAGFFTGPRRGGCGFLGILAGLYGREEDGGNLEEERIYSNQS
jgi:hypothetical protein